MLEHLEMSIEKSPLTLLQCMLLRSADNILFVDQGRFAAFKPRVHLPPRPKREWSNKEKMWGNNPSGSFSIFKFQEQPFAIAKIFKWRRVESECRWFWSFPSYLPYKIVIVIKLCRSARRHLSPPREKTVLLYASTHPAWCWDNASETSAAFSIRFITSV